MASSEVGIVSGSNPFGCVLKDHNRRDHLFRDPNDQSHTNTNTNTTTATTTNNNNNNPITKSNSNFQKNLKDLVRDHLHSCITSNPTEEDDENFNSNSNPNSNPNPNSNSNVVNPNPNPRNRFTSPGCCGRAIRNRRTNNHRHQPLASNPQRSEETSDDDEGEPPRLYPPPTMSRRQARVLDRWATQQAKETITTAAANQQVDIPTTFSSSADNVSSTKASSSSFSFPREPSPAPSDCSSSSAPVSSLVQKWSTKFPPPSPPVLHQHHLDTHDQPSTSNFQCRTTSRSNSVASSAAESGCHHDNESLSDWESDRGAATNTTPATEWHSVDEEEESDPGKKLKEGERVKVSEIIKKWPAGTKKRLSGAESGGEEDNVGQTAATAAEHQQQQPQQPQQQQHQHQMPPLVTPLTRLRLELGHQHHGGDPGGFFMSPGLSSPRIRGRQAAEDVIARIERSRYDEIERLSDRCPVTKFHQRGRLQAMVKLMSLRRDVMGTDEQLRAREPPPPKRVYKPKSSNQPKREVLSASASASASGDEMESPPRTGSKEKPSQMPKPNREVFASGDELESPPRRASKDKPNQLLPKQNQPKQEVSTSGDELESPPRRAFKDKSIQLPTQSQPKREVSDERDSSSRRASRDKPSQLPKQKQPKREVSASGDERESPPRRASKVKSNQLPKQNQPKREVSASGDEMESPPRRTKPSQLPKQNQPKREVSASGDETDSPPRRAKPSQLPKRNQPKREVSASGDETDSPPRRAKPSQLPKQNQPKREVSASGDETDSPPRRAKPSQLPKQNQPKREVSASGDETNSPPRRASKEKSNQYPQQKPEASVSQDEPVSPSRIATEKSSHSQQLKNPEVSGASSKDESKRRQDQESPARRACKEKANQLHQQLSPILVAAEDERRRHQEQPSSPSRTSTEKPANQLQHQQNDGSKPANQLQHQQNEGSQSSSPTSSVTSLRERFNNAKAEPQKSECKARSPRNAVETSSNTLSDHGHQTNVDKACDNRSNAPPSSSSTRVVSGKSNQRENLISDKIRNKVAAASKLFVEAGKRIDPQEELKEKIAKIAANNLDGDMQKRASSDDDAITKNSSSNDTITRKAAPAAPPPPPPLRPIKTLLPQPVPTQPPPTEAAKSAVVVAPSNPLDAAFDNPSTSTSTSTSPGVVWHDSASYDGVVYGSSDASLSFTSWTAEETEEEEEEEEVAIDHEYYEANLDWIDNIARPRSYWEDQRQARYEEVQSSENVEMRQLLERGSVSAVLASGFRERIDQLMMSCVQRHTLGPESIEDEDEDDHSMMMLIRRQMQSLNREEEEQPGSEEEIRGGGGGGGEGQEQVMDSFVEAREDAGDRIRHEVEEVDDAEENGSLSSYQDTEIISNNSDNADGPTVRPQQQPESLTAHNPYGQQDGSLFKNGTSMEMELIFDLRSHMVQLYHEMAELRKSINSCTQVQEKMMHRLMKDEVVAASVSPSADSGRKDKKESPKKKGPKKGCCCICFEKKIDSLLYRCGHMCTCFNCAHELQSSDKKCPICRVQIVDVVRAYIDS